MLRRKSPGAYREKKNDGDDTTDQKSFVQWKKAQDRRKKRYRPFLEKIYLDLNSPSFFASPRNIYLAARKKIPSITQNDVNEWLSGKRSYTFHRRAVQKFQRRKVVTSGIDHQWQADLMDVRHSKRQNGGTTFLLVVIDVFSRFVFVRPLLSKTSTAVAAAFSNILKKHKRKPFKLQTDKGTEFLGWPFQTMLRENRIHHFTTHQDVKAQIAERFNRTIRELMTRWATETDQDTYLRVLPKLVYFYNYKRKHTAFGTPPGKVTRRNQRLIFDRQYRKYLSAVPRRHKFNVGDTVRLTAWRPTFHRAKHKNFTRRLFNVINKMHTNPPTYQVLDDEGEPIHGAIYESEMQLAREE